MATAHPPTASASRRWRRFAWQSLQTRVTLFTLAIFLLSIWSLALMGGYVLRQDMQRVLGEQQYSTATLAAAEINRDIEERMTTLKQVAEGISAATLADTKALQALLEQRPGLQVLFNGGVFVTRTDAVAVADMPAVPGRVGTSYADNEAFRLVLRTGQATLGRPVVGKKLQMPVFPMIAPIRDRDGRVIGALNGVTNLGRPSFLDDIAEGRYGKTGSYLLMAPQHGLIVTGTDKTRVMNPMPAPGANAMHDRYMQGYEGYGVATSSRGVQELSAARRIPAAGWFVVAVLPTAEAFAPIDAVQQRLLMATLLLSVLSGALTWWAVRHIVRRQLAPVMTASTVLSAQADAHTLAQSLPATARQDEIGTLMVAFNQQLMALGQREAELRESEARFKALSEASFGGIGIHDQGQILECNQGLTMLTGFSRAELLGMNGFGLIAPESLDTVIANVQRGYAEDYEVLGVRKDGSRYDLAIRGKSIRYHGKDVRVVEFRDISERKRSERVLENFFAQATGLNLIAKLDGTLIRYNQGWQNLLGYPPESLAGANVLDLVHPDDHASTMAQLKLLGQGVNVCHFENRALKADGSYCLLEWSASASITEQMIYAAAADITETRRAEKALQDSELRYRSLADRSPLAIQAFAPDGFTLRVNQAWEVMWHCPFASLQGYNVLQDAQLDAIGILGPLKQVFDGTAIEFPEHKYARPQAAGLSPGELVLWIRAFAYPILGEDGQLLEVVVVQEDITARKVAEEKLQLAANVFTHAREGILITDASATIMEVNDTFTRITGYSREEVLGQNPRLLKSSRQTPEFYAAMWQSLVEKGHWYGEVWNRRKSGEIYAEMLTISAVRDESGTTKHYVALFTDITVMKQQQQRLEHIAHFDALTNLPNRVLLADRLQQAMLQTQRRGKNLAVVYLDLDGFKQVNDQHGHDVGDTLLIAVSQHIKDALREGDSLARIGGDEFVAVLVDLDGASDCEPVLNRLLLAAGTPVTIQVATGPTQLQVSASIGVTLYPQDGVDADLLLRHADQAMYLAKDAGKNRFHFYDVVTAVAVQSQRQSLQNLAQALAEQQFVLHYQPKVNMKTGAVVGAEALIRWQHPQRGLLAPGLFLPMIDNHPLGIAVGEWVITTAITQMARWHTQGLDLPVSVNIGAAQLQQDGFATRLGALLSAQPDVQPGWLQLEVLETSALDDMAHVTAAMAACQILGISFALDDFGTGYSSLTYLRRLPAQTLKIDQSFVRDMLQDPDDLAIVQGVIGLAHTFGRSVIAEGVETAAHGARLLALGCELAQGYGIARPMPAQDLPQWVQVWQQQGQWTA